MLNKKRLIMSICPVCKELSVVFTDSLTIVCKCSNITEFTFKDLKRGQYLCPNCEQQTYFSVLGELKDIKCKSCNSWIDFTWHTKLDKYVSLNMIK